MQHASLCVAALVLALGSFQAEAKGFLVDRPSLRSRADVNSFQTHLGDAVAEALGCGGHVSQEQLASIEAALQPIWRSLPKSERGRVERRSLRYLAHRYFTQKSAFLIRGFEPSRPTNASEWGAEDILSLRVPAYVESVLESQHKQEHGFDIQDAVHMVAALERLLFDAESEMLAKAFESQGKDISESLDGRNLEGVLRDYIIHWMMGTDDETLGAALKDRRIVEHALPKWKEIQAFIRGQVKALEFGRQHEPLAETRPRHHALSQQFSFEDAHRAVGAITTSFAHFWDSECSDMKEALVEMDTHHTGRVPLSKFYSSALETEWRFGESESYLRELGALDETSVWGKQVIIPNYLQATSNCIVSTQHYLVCCVNECEGLLREIEVKVQRPAATPAELLTLVGNMTSQTSLDHDEAPHLGASHRTQLEQIAATHGGVVPLHGRLFAQWLHYVFPRECPFPHKVGTASLKTPSEFGDSAIATKSDMEDHASSEASDLPSRVEKDELEWMSQWDSEEELVVGSLGQMRPAESTDRLAVGGAALLLVLGIFGVGASRKSTGSKDEFLLPTHMKAHLV